MDYKELFIFVEGVDDKRFIDTIILPFLDKKGNYSFIKVIEYASLSHHAIRIILNTTTHKATQDYIFVCDMDGITDPNASISKRKEKESEKYGNSLDIKKTFVVKEEIESWYYAGITTTKLTELELPFFQNTETLTKEEFEKMIPKTFISPNDFMVEILKEYVLDEGKEKNASLNYFIGKLETDY